MKLLWLCNMEPGILQEMRTGKKGGGLWIDNMLADLRRQADITIRVLYPAAQVQDHSLDEKCSCASFSEGLPYVYLPELEAQFCKELDAFRPDVIHIWGTEYGHTLAMVNASEKCGVLNRTVISIQGLCSIIAQHYAEGVPHNVQNQYTFRDFVRQDSIAQQQKKFALRGKLEVQALRKVRHVIGRTDWDEACTKQINPDVNYHFCNETLRVPFYEGKWQYDSCQKHRIFASSSFYPVKGFHYLLEAFAEVLKTYPDATLAVPGRNCLAQGFSAKLRENSYQKYLAALIRQYGLEEKVEFLGGLSAEQMKENYLKANAFVLPSTIENSPNSLGEAMLLGVPCVASDVGGVATMMSHRNEGFVYQSTAPYMLAHYIKCVFAMGEQAQVMGDAARHHAQRTHDPEKNRKDLMEIYKKIMK